MTGLEVYNYFLQVFKRTDKSAEVYTSMADTVMDMRSRMVSDEHSSVSSALAGIVSIGDYQLDIPADFGHLIGDVLIRDTASDFSYLPLNKISKEEFDIKYSQITSTAVGNRQTGVPVDYCFFGRNILVAPAVDKTTYEFKINYTTEDLPIYTASTATIPFTPQFREVLRAGMLYRMFFEMGLNTESDRWAMFYADGINKITSNDENNTQGSSVNIQYQGI